MGDLLPYPDGESQSIIVLRSTFGRTIISDIMDILLNNQNNIIPSLFLVSVSSILLAFSTIVVNFILIFNKTQTSQLTFIHIVREIEKCM